MASAAAGRGHVLKLLYFTLFGSKGVIFPFMPLLWAGKSFKGSAIGVLSSVAPVVAFVAAPTLCHFADRTATHRMMFIWCLVLSGAGQFVYLFVDDFVALVAIVVVVSFLSAPVGSLLDAAVMASIGPDLYGSQRLWGALGFGTMVFLAGSFKDILGWTGVFSVYAIVLSLAVVVAGLNADLMAALSSATEQQDVTKDVLAQAPSALRSWTTLAVFFTITLSGVSSGVIDSFLIVRLSELGGSGLLIGLARAISCFVEVPFFSASGALNRYLGVKRVMVLAQLAYALRFAYYALLREPWAVLPCEILHGLTFAAMWSASTTFAHDVSGKKSSVMQGVVTGLHWGLGFAGGALGGGYWYQKEGAVNTFRGGVCVALVSALSVGIADLSTCRTRSVAGASGVSVEMTQPYEVVPAVPDGAFLQEERGARREEIDERGAAVCM